MRIEQVGTQLYVWLQMLGREGKSVHDHLDAVFGEVAAAGIEGSEGWLEWAETPRRAAELRALYDKHDVEPLSMYAGGAYHDADEAQKTVDGIVRLAEVARETLNCPSVTTNPNPIGRDKTDDELRAQADALNRLGRELRALGMRLLVHNHDPEIRNDAREFRMNAALTDPEVVDFCVDAHWIYRGGGDPVELLREVVHRTKTLHLRNSENGVWSETFGAGDIDYRDIRAILEEADFEGSLILELAYDKETPLTRSLVENARIGREYIREIFGA